MPSRNQRFDHQSIEPRVAIIQPCEVHATVPPLQEIHVETQTFQQRARYVKASPLRTTLHSLLEIISRHASHFPPRYYKVTGSLRSLEPVCHKKERHGWANARCELKPVEINAPVIATRLRWLAAAEPNCRPC